MALRQEVSDSYEPVENPLQYVEDLYERFRQDIPPNALAVVLLPPTFAPRPNGAVALEDQIESNMRVRRALSGLSNVKIIEMENRADSIEKMHEYSHLHFKREVYHELFLDIMREYKQWAAARV